LCLWAGLAGSDALSQRPLYTATKEGTLGTILGLRDRHVQRGKSRINDGSAAPSAHRVPETLARCPCLPTCSQLPKTEASVGGRSVASQEGRRRCSSRLQRTPGRCANAPTSLRPGRRCRAARGPRFRAANFPACCHGTCGVQTHWQTHWRGKACGRKVRQAPYRATLLQVSRIVLVESRRFCTPILYAECSPSERI